MGHNHRRYNRSWRHHSSGHYWSWMWFKPRRSWFLEKLWRNTGKWYWWWWKWLYRWLWWMECNLPQRRCPGPWPRNACCRYCRCHWQQRNRCLRCKLECENPSCCMPYRHWIINCRGVRLCLWGSVKIRRNRWPAWRFCGSKQRLFWRGSWRPWWLSYLGIHVRFSWSDWNSGSWCHCQRKLEYWCTWWCSYRICKRVVDCSNQYR